MDYENLVLELELSENISLKELKEIYRIVKYIPWNEKEILEIKRAYTIIKSMNKDHYDSNSFNKDIIRVCTPHPKTISKTIPIPKIIPKLTGKLKKN